MNLKSITITKLLLCIVIAFTASFSSAETAYYEVRPVLTVNFGDARRIRFIQTQVTLRVREKENVPMVDKHRDAIRHTVIMMFAEQDEATLRSSEARDEFLTLMTKAIQNLLRKETGNPMIDRVLLTSFIIQP